MFRNYEYLLNRTHRDGRKVWRCVRKRCLVKLCTLGENLLKCENSKEHKHLSYGEQFKRGFGSYNLVPALQLGENEDPEPLIWYSTELKFYTNQNGKQCVRFRCYDYYCYDKGGKIVCNCCDGMCSASAVIDGQGNIRFAPRKHVHRKPKNVFVPDDLLTQTLNGQNLIPAVIEEQVEAVQVKLEPVDLELL